MVQTRSAYRMAREIGTIVEGVEQRVDRILNICSWIVVSGTMYGLYLNTPHSIICVFLLNILVMLFYNIWLHSSDF